MCRVFFLAGAALDGVKLVERTAGQFAGALQGQRANKGVFITTSGFSREAHEYAGIIPSKIILVGGEQLAALMVDHNVGVSPVSRFEIKRVDSDYFVGPEQSASPCPDAG